MNLSTLAANLQEIYGAGQGPLVADAFGTRVFDRSCGWGKWFWSKIFLLSGKKAEQDALNNALQETADIFNSNLPLIEKDAQICQAYLTGQGVEYRDWLRACRHIVAWNRSTAPFLISIKSTPNERLPGITWNPKFKLYQKLQHIIALEEDLFDPLPVTILQQLATGAPLSSHEERALKKWIEKLNKMKNQIKVGLFHNAMSTFVSLLDQDPTTLVRLEYALLKKGLKIFTQKDPEHIKKRNSLRPGKPITINGISFIFGEQIGRKPFDDSNIVFEIESVEIEGDEEEHQRYVAVSGINPTIPGLQEESSKENGWGIRHAELIALKKQFAIYERLLPFDKSKHCDSVAKLIARCIEWDGIPKGLIPENLMFDKHGNPRSPRPRAWDPFSFSTLENLAYKIFPEDDWESFMKTPTLSSHPCWIHYKKMIKNALKGKDRPKKNEDANRDGISDPLSTRRGISLFDSVRELQKLAFNSASEQQLKEKQMELFNKNGCIAILRKGLLEEVINSVKNSRE